MEIVSAYRTVNHITLVGIYHRYWSQRHGEVGNLRCCIRLVMRCGSVCLYLFRYLGVERQTDGGPAIIYISLLIAFHFLDIKRVWIGYHIFYRLGSSSQSATLVGSTYTVGTGTIVGQIHLIAGGILQIDPIACFILLEEEVAECFVLKIPFQEIVFQLNLIIPFDLTFCILSACVLATLCVDLGTEFVGFETVGTTQCISLGIGCCLNIAEYAFFRTGSW